MAIHSIDHVQFGFAKGREAELRHFYGDLLGLSEVVDGEGRPGTLRFEAGAQRIDFVALPRPLPGEGVHLALSVEGLPSLRQRLQRAGVAIDEQRPLPGHRRLYVQDPAGHRIELLEPVWQEAA
ncbi:VOC family protein [Acidovorax lacteus]|uniref:VOC family protein n=1 Tax=Acidovorax lacteus TaxID=1924988 RepID=A0ABP8LFD5_9BURK